MIFILKQMFYYYLMFLKSFLENICWSCRRLQHVFIITIFRLPKCLEDVWKTFCKTFWRRLEDVLEGEKLLRWRRVLKTSWRNVLKMSWRHVLKTSWRHYGGKQNVSWQYLYLINPNVYLTNLCFIYIWQMEGKSKMH